MRKTIKNFFNTSIYILETTTDAKNHAYFWTVLNYLIVLPENLYLFFLICQMICKFYLYIFYICTNYIHTCSTSNDIHTDERLELILRDIQELGEGGDSREKVITLHTRIIRISVSSVHVVRS